METEIILREAEMAICFSCGEPMACPDKSGSDNPNVCPSCASLLEDIQDSTIIESAIPYESDSPSGAKAEQPPQAKADESREDSAELAPHDIPK